MIFRAVFRLHCISKNFIFLATQGKFGLRGQSEWRYYARSLYHNENRALRRTLFGDAVGRDKRDHKALSNLLSTVR